MITSLHRLRTICFMLLLLLVCTTAPVVAQSATFSYQGKLADNGNPANGNYDFQFGLWDSLSGGATVGTSNTKLGVTVTNGSFSVTLDFGAAAFPGANRFLEIAVRPANTGSYTTLTPRQQMLSTPYAIKATAADGLSVACVNCVTGSQIASVNGSVVSGTIPVASVPAGSSNYIQNTTSQQATSNFNISGNGTAGGTLSGSIVNAATQFNLGGSHVLSSPGGVNLFAGFGAGTNNTDGQVNAFFGVVAGQANTTGSANSFFGAEAGRVNTTGSYNSFFGTDAGRMNTTGSNNAFFGPNAGHANTIGNDNAFFGDAAGFYNTGSKNVFFGKWSGYSNTIGENNTFIGFQAGQTHTTGNFNTIIGANADFSNISPAGNYNTMLGYGSRVSSGVNNATAIGANAWAALNNTLILGSIAGFNGATDTVNVGIGTIAPAYRLDVAGGVRSFDSISTHFVAETTGGTNSWARIFMRTPNRGYFIGTSRGFLDDQFYIWDETANQIRMAITTTGNVGIGTVNPAALLQVAGDIRIGTGFTGCVLDADGSVIAGICSSDVRLKRDIVPFAHLLEKVAQLQPVHFYWRADEFKERHFGTKPSFGLIAQEVEKVLPELVTEDEQGYKAVNYSKLSLLTLQAIKELKAENDALKQRLSEQQASAALQQQQSRQLKKQQAQIERQQSEIDELRQAVKALQSSIHNRHRK